MELLAKAKKVLENNWRGSHTVPSPYLYPHQWSWDSAFTALGYAHYDTDKAMRELRSMLEGQWKNGMIPHIIFRSKESYFPGPGFWDSKRSNNAPDIETSGITQPPVHALAALKIYQLADDKKTAEGFLKEIFPKLLAFHRYMLTERDPEKTGLVTIYHPWESGFDNSVRWDEPLARVKPENLPEYERVDNKKIDSNQRPDDATYDKFVYLVEIMKKHDYDDRRIYAEIPFKVKDISCSTILYSANLALKDIAGIIKEDDSEIRKWIERTKKNFLPKLCKKNGDRPLIYDYDLMGRKHIEKRTVASLLAVCTDFLKYEEIARVVSFMEHSHVCTQGCTHSHNVITSIATQSKDFNPMNYWRGPVWININWMIYYGLKNYGIKEKADILKKAIIELTEEHGFYEYYNPLTSEGLGTNNFSWTAALVIDLLMQKH